MHMAWQPIHEFRVRVRVRSRVRAGIRVRIRVRVRARWNIMGENFPEDLTG